PLTNKQVLKNKKISRSIITIQCTAIICGGILLDRFVLLFYVAATTTFVVAILLYFGRQKGNVK
ncbi:hypothetical protein, partial [Ethanoligenens sp.]|uniref:hypothetical protein n=1 Tax=Ethanoligenens sp. TaxID=2099655 RepID=UPI0039ECE8F3